MNTKVMDEQKELLTKQLETLQKQHQQLTTDLNNVTTNINGTLGALQYHDYLINKLKEETTPTTSEQKATSKNTEEVEYTDIRN